MRCDWRYRCATGGCILLRLTTYGGDRREADKRIQSATVADLLLQVQALLFKSWSGLNWSEIDALCRRVLALEPDNKRAMKHLAVSLTAHNIVQRGLTRTQVTARYREAGALARRVLAADPNDSQMYNVLSWEAADQDDFSNRRQYLEKGIALRPYNSSTLINLGDLESALGNNEQAYQYYERLRTCRSTVRTSITCRASPRWHFQESRAAPRPDFVGDRRNPVGSCKTYALHWQA